MDPRSVSSRQLTPNRPQAGTTKIALDLRGGDVWAWEKRLTGTCPDCALDADVSIRVNGARATTERDGDAFAAVVALRPGANCVTAVLTLADGGLVESEPVIHTVRLTPHPVARISPEVRGESVVLGGLESEPSAYHPTPIERWEWAFHAENPAALDVIAEDDASIVVRTPRVDGDYLVSLTVTDAAGRTDTGAVRFVVEDGSARVPDPLTEQAAWIERATVYGAIPFTFGQPGFAALAERLDDLRDLGIAAIWLSPVTRTLPGDFGYAVTDYFDTRPDYGTKEDLRALVEAAHARGIRVLIDFVPNHTSIRHPYFADAEANGDASPYVDFYDRDEDGEATYYFHYAHLRNLDFDNPEVRTFISEALACWMRELDIDGFRVDVAWGIRERQPDFWPACNAELKRIKPDALLIAEASARDPFYAVNGFDAAYDWTGKLGEWAWSAFLDNGTPMADGVTKAIETTARVGDPEALVFRFLNNNDTGPRFITTRGVDCYRVASAMLLTLPGLPCVYNGDEVGAEFLPYDDVAIDWTDRHGLRDHFTRLIALRVQQPALHSREWMPIPVEPARPLFGYLRYRAAGGSPVLVLLNVSPAELDATVPLPDAFAGILGRGELTDLYARERIRVAVADHLTVPMPAWGIRILVPEGSDRDRERCITAQPTARPP